MPVTYVSDHDWEKCSTFDIENLFGTNSENYEVNNCCTISTIHVPSYDDMFDEYALEDSYSIAYDNYGDENSYFGEFAPTTIVYVGSINSFVHVTSRKRLIDRCFISGAHYSICSTSIY
jgi:hypothetical protein